MIVILLGLPGSGKGTQAKALCGRYGLTHLATGDIFRSEISAKTPFGAKAADYMKKGQLVPDDLVTEMVAGRMDMTGRYLLDGFPRTIEQAEEFGKGLAQEGAKVNLTVLLSLTNEEALRRLTARRVCGKCGEVFNVLTKKPTSEDKCDSCQGDLIQRNDDARETVAKRLMVFEDLTQPLVTFYRNEGVFEEVDGSRAPAEVTNSLIQVFDRVLKQKA